MASSKSPIQRVIGFLECSEYISEKSRKNYCGSCYYDAKLERKTPTTGTL
jgi:hypothetical protein